MLRRLLVAVLLSVALGLPAAPRAGASPHERVVVMPSTPGTTEPVPGTTLEAEERDQGSALAPWLIGSGVLAVGSIAIGGTILKRRMD